MAAGLSMPGTSRAGSRDLPYSTWCKANSHDYCGGRRGRSPRLPCECPCGHEWLKRKAEMDATRRKRTGPKVS